jgi:DNA-binding transcriptional MerR regulator
VHEQFEPRFTARELEEASGISRRTIRLYISQGLVPPARGRGRSAYYTSEHLEALARISDARQRGLSLSEIGTTVGQNRAPHIQSGEDWRRFILADGVELLVRSDDANQHASLVQAIIAIAGRAPSDDGSR